MTLNESIVEDAALEWFGELIRANWGLFGPIGAYSLQMNSKTTPIGRNES